MFFKYALLKTKVEFSNFLKAWSTEASKKLLEEMLFEKVEKKESKIMASQEFSNPPFSLTYSIKGR
jgi:predicted lipoprotein